MKLEFSSIEELKEFVTQLKGTRGRKGESDGEANPGPQAPTPIAPPTGAPAFQSPTASQGFAPPTNSHGVGTPFSSGADPAVAALVKRINDATDAQLIKGSDLNAALGWFRQQCGPDAAAATMEQIKAVFLPRLPATALENIAKLIGA